MKTKHRFTLMSTLPILFFLVFATSALAAPPLPRTGLVPPLESHRSPISAAEAVELMGTLSQPRPVANDLLLFELPAGTPSGRHDLDATFLHRGKRLFTERLTFETVRDGARTVELLAWHPRQRAEVLKLALDPANEVKVSIVLDASRRVLPLERLITQTKVLQQIGFEPVETRLQGGPTEPGLSGIFAKNQAECLQSCSDTYDSCTYGCSVYACIQECQYAYNNCQAGCPPDCTGPTVREYTNSWITSYVPVADGCYEDIFYPYPGKRYVLLYVTQKNEKHRETTYCDGSKTDEVIEVTYSNYYCWARTDTSCSPTYGWAGSLYLCQ